MVKFNSLLYELFFFLLIAAPLWVVVVSEAEKKNCQFGLTANDIAASSGMDLSGKIALVTGGRSGLGYAVAEAMLRQNATVIIASRNVEKNQQAVESLRASVGPGANITYSIFDLEDFKNVQEFATAFTNNYTRLDYYFANAGQGGSGAKPLTVDGYERIFQVNYVGQFLLVQLLLPLIRQSQPARILFTGSSTHVMACGTLGLAKENKEEDHCFDDNFEENAISMLPFDEEHLSIFDSDFQCPPLNGPYAVTKQLFIQLAKELSKREAQAGNEVYVYTWAPGSIKTDLNPWAFCCTGPIETMGRDTCRYILPYVGPVDDQGNPAPNASDTHWVSPPHGAMSGLYTALHAPTEEAGFFYATYLECAPNMGLYPQGITAQGREKLYEDSFVWAGLKEKSDYVAPAAESGDTDLPQEDKTSSGSPFGSWIKNGSMILLALVLLFALF